MNEQKKIYFCVQCNAESHVSGRYLAFSYVLANCCSIACERKQSGAASAICAASAIAIDVPDDC